MHETHLFKNLIAYLHEEERTSCRRIEKIHVQLSDFSGLSDDHFMEHYAAGCKGTRWEHLGIELSRVPYGPEFTITRIDFADDSCADPVRAVTRSRQ